MPLVLRFEDRHQHHQHDRGTLLPDYGSPLTGAACQSCKTLPLVADTLKTCRKLVPRSQTHGLICVCQFWSLRGSRRFRLVESKHARFWATIGWSNAPRFMVKDFRCGRRPVLSPGRWEASLWGKSRFADF